MGGIKYIKFIARASLCALDNLYGTEYLHLSGIHSRQVSPPKSQASPAMSFHLIYGTQIITLLHPHPLGNRLSTRLHWTIPTELVGIQEISKCALLSICNPDVDPCVQFIACTCMSVKFCLSPPHPLSKIMRCVATVPSVLKLFAFLSFGAGHGTALVTPYPCLFIIAKEGYVYCSIRVPIHLLVNYCKGMVGVLLHQGP